METTYTPFIYEYGSHPMVTHAKLDKIIMSESDVTLSFFEGYMVLDGEQEQFRPIGSDHVSIPGKDFEDVFNSNVVMAITANKNTKSSAVEESVIEESIV